MKSNSEAALREQVERLTEALRWAWDNLSTVVDVENGAWEECAVCREVLPDHKNDCELQAREAEVLAALTGSSGVPNIPDPPPPPPPKEFPAAGPWKTQGVMPKNSLWLFKTEDGFVATNNPTACGIEVKGSSGSIFDSVVAFAEINFPPNLEDQQISKA